MRMFCGYMGSNMSLTMLSQTSLMQLQKSPKIINLNLNHSLFAKQIFLVLRHLRSKPNNKSHSKWPNTLLCLNTIGLQFM